MYVRIYIYIYTTFPKGPGTHTVYIWATFRLMFVLYVYIDPWALSPGVGLQDVRLDERVEQLFGIVNGLASNGTASGLRLVITWEILVM